MKKNYEQPFTVLCQVKTESSFMSASAPVRELSVETEVDDYIAIEKMEISFD